ncbi:UNVERIFIED_CONTAM: hypothetical protein FKN15_031142 [Acipenser sinensis]
MNECKRNTYSIEVRNKFQALQNEASPADDDDVNVKWNPIKTEYCQSSEKVLGFKKREHKEWISAATWALIQQRKNIKYKINQTSSESQKDRLRIQYTETNKLVKKSARRDKRPYIENMAAKAEAAASRNKLRTVYNITQQICRQTCTPVRNKNGKLLTTEEEQGRQWGENFREVLNRPEPLQPAEITPAEEDLEMNIEPRSKEETNAAIFSLKNKAPGMDQLNARLFKADLDTAIEAVLYC